MQMHVKQDGSWLTICLRSLIALVSAASFRSELGWGMTSDGLQVSRLKEEQTNYSRSRLATTYANRKNDPEIFVMWKDYVGLWISRDDSGQKMLSVALIPRRPRPGIDPSHGTLAGFIPGGDYEGVLFFTKPPHDALPYRGIGLLGNLYRADRHLTRVKAVLIFPSPQRNPSRETHARYLILQVDQQDRQRQFLLERVDDVDDAALSAVSIIAHRGLGFAGLDNTATALGHAWYFGASGIEFDITVPFTYTNTSNGRALRLPLTSRSLVYHPPLIYQTRDVDQIPPGFLATKQVFDHLENYGVPFIYVDPKVKWLSEDIRREVLETIITFAHEALSRTRTLSITIAAPDDHTANFLSDSKTFQSSHHFATGRLSWTLEWTEVTEATNFLRGDKDAPFALSFNLMGIRRGSKWPLIEWIFKDIAQHEETEIANRNHPLIFWTANTGDHFTAAVEAARQSYRMGRFGDPRQIAIMTDYPHRLAYWLATTRGDKR